MISLTMHKQHSIPPKSTSSSSLSLLSGAFSSLSESESCRVRALKVPWSLLPDIEVYHFINVRIINRL